MAQQNADRELLFGILALQHDFVDRQTLIAAFDRWVHDKRQPLGEILLQQGALSPDDHSLLSTLVERHLRKHGDDVERSLAALAADGDVREELSRLADPDLGASLLAAGLRPSTSPAGPPTTVAFAAADAPAGERFRIVRPHAKGALGEVYLAEDGELHRHVALKQIQERHAHDPASRARFLLEAEITGGLEHPGIVPIYSLGHYADGRPYYAMRFIKGDNLQQAIRRFHGEREQETGDGRTRGGGEKVKRGGGDEAAEGASNPQFATRNPQFHFASLEFRQLLGRFLDVCQAVEYAHSRGVLHRDLKPGNVMLGKHGETLVVDWGLAKAVGRDEKTAAAVSDEATLHPLSAEGSEPTRQGAVLGTPEYMSPEQAAGRLDQLGPASDVYGLGATFYCLLAGQPPFRRGRGESEGELLRRVELGEFPAPRQVNRFIPRPLEAICLKALAGPPQARYASARALADDVERWLADEPVAAHRSGTVERAGRWLRRHRAAARAAAVALVVVVAALLTTLGVVDAARRKTGTALAAETAAKNEAKAAIDRYAETVQESELLKDERFQPLRKKLLSDALGYYQAFIEAHQHDAAARRDLATALFKVGLISSASGSASDAVAAYQGAVALREKLAAEYPNVAEYQSDLAGSYNNLGILQGEMGDREAALISYQRALDVREKLAAENPDFPEYQSHLANSYYNLGHLQQATGDREAALAGYQRALAIRKKLAAENPTVVDYRSHLAQSYGNLGLQQHATGDRKAALLSYHRALAIQEKLAAENPSVTGYQNDLASSHGNVGILQIETGDREAALGSFQRVLTIKEKLAAENPTVTHYQNALATSYYELGTLQHATGDRVAALASRRSALTVSEKLAAENPTVTQYQNALATSYYGLGLLLAETGDREKALVSYRRAVDLQENLGTKNPSVTEYQSGLAKSYHNLGVLQSETGDREGALASYRRALAVQEKLAARHPDVLDYQVGVGGSCCNLGNLASNGGDEEGALVWYGRAAEALRRVVDRDNRDAIARTFLRETHRRRAAALGTLARHAEAAGDWQRAAELDDGRMRTTFRLSRVGALARAGDHARAAAEAGELAMIDPLAADALYNLACAFSLCAAAAKDDAALAERYAARALELLARARAAGFFNAAANVEHFGNDKDLEALRERDDFRKFIEALPKTPPAGRE